MKPLEILLDLAKRPVAASAPLPFSPDEIIDSPAFAMPCRLVEEPVMLRPASVEAAESEMLALSVTFADEPHTLCVARSPRFPDLDKMWDSRADVPEPIMLALVERECGPLLQLIENAVRKQLQLVGLANGASGEPAVQFSVSASQPDEKGPQPIVFSLTRSASVVSALGVLRNLDLAHDAIRTPTFPAEIEYAAFQMPEADLASLAPGDAVLLPEIGTLSPRLVAGGRFVMDGNGVVPYQEDAMCRVRAATGRTVSVGELFDAADAERVSAAEKDDSKHVLPVDTQLRLVRRGRTLATGRLDRLGEQPALIVES